MLKWFDIPTRPTARVLRQFAVGWLLFFGALSRIWLRRGDEGAGLALLLAALAVGLLGLLKPAAIRPLFVAAMALSLPVGWIISQILLALVFFLVFTPLAVGFRLLGRDALARKPAPHRATFWVAKGTPEDPRTYFRQY
jgi:hypothetical protein